jgi:putative ABC transport system permease protein
MLEKGDTDSVMIGHLFKNGNIFNKPVGAGDRITLNGKRFKVKTILKQVGNPTDDSSIGMAMEDFRELFEIPNRVDQVVVKIDEGEDVLEVGERIENKLRKSRGLTEDTQDFVIITPEEALASFQVVLNIILAFLAGVATISLLVGGIGIANTMYTSVLERTKEIGIMKSIGAKNKDILIIFLIESGLLGLVGAAIGVLLGYGVSKGIEFIAVNSLNTTLLRAAAPAYLIIGCLAFGFIIGAVSGLLPAWQASKTNVVDALRYE